MRTPCRGHKATPEQNTTVTGNLQMKDITVCSYAVALTYHACGRKQRHVCPQQPRAIGNATPHDYASVCQSRCNGGCNASHLKKRARKA